MTKTTRALDRTSGSDPTPEQTAESPSRWVLHCIACDTPVEPWQTIGYQHGYCAQCYGVLMGTDGSS